MAEDEKKKPGEPPKHGKHEEKKEAKPAKPEHKGEKPAEKKRDEHEGHAHAKEVKKEAKPAEKPAEKKSAEDEDAEEGKEAPAGEKKEEKKEEKKAPEPREKSEKKKHKLKERPKREKREVKPGEIPVLAVDGTVVDAVRPPTWFGRIPYRPDVIRRAVSSIQANRRQPYGPPETSGMRHSVYWWGKGRGVSRTPRLKGSSTGAQAPNTVGGRRAHPPKVERDWSKKLNSKEMHLARLSAMRAAADPKLVLARGHKFSEETFIPVIVEDEIEVLVRTEAEMVPLLKRAGVYADVLRAAEGRHVRAGRGKMRGRRHRTPKSILFIVKDPRGAPAASNLPGADVRPVTSVNVEDLAPGGDPGRLVVFSKSAFEEVSKWA